MASRWGLASWAKPRHAPRCPQQEFHAVQPAFSGRSHYQQRDTVVGSKSSVFLAELHTFIEHATSLITNSVTRAFVMISRQSFNYLNQSKRGGHVWETLLAFVRRPICRQFSQQRRSNTTLSTLIARIEFPDACCLHCSNNRPVTTIVKVFT